jgi:hypothetical protein
VDRVSAERAVRRVRRAGGVVILHTASLRYDGDGRLDVSRVGGHAVGVAFAPSRELFGWSRRQLRTRTWFAEYARRYAAELEASARERAAAWDDVLARERVTVCCYCANPSACHRTLLAAALVARGVTYLGEVEP